MLATERDAGIGFRLSNGINNKGKQIIWMSCFGNN